MARDYRSSALRNSTSWETGFVSTFQAHLQIIAKHVEQAFGISARRKIAEVAAFTIDQIQVRTAIDKIVRPTARQYFLEEIGRADIRAEHVAEVQQHEFTAIVRQGAARPARVGQGDLPPGTRLR